MINTLDYAQIQTHFLQFQPMLHLKIHPFNSQTVAKPTGPLGSSQHFISTMSLITLNRMIKITNYYFLLPFQHFQSTARSYQVSARSTASETGSIQTALQATPGPLHNSCGTSMESHYRSKNTPRATGVKMRSLLQALPWT